jgi:hypothetical protein
MSIFARIFRFFSAFLPDKAEAVKHQKMAMGKSHDPVLAARRELAKKRAKSEGSWGETQFFKPD